MVQGFEHIALKSIEDKINYVSIDAKEIPRFIYKHNGEQCYYFPDFLVETLNGEQRVIEVKSSLTIRNPRNAAKFKAATEGCKKLGMSFLVCVLYDRITPKWFKNPTKVPKF